MHDKPIVTCRACIRLCIWSMQHLARLHRLQTAALINTVESCNFMHAPSSNWRLAGLTALEELVLWGEFDPEGYTFLPLPSDETLSRLTKLTSLKLHVSVSQVFWQNTL